MASYKPRKASQVGELMASHFSAVQVAQRQPRPDQGLSFRDTADDSSDSGLESII